MSNALFRRSLARLGLAILAVAFAGATLGAAPAKKNPSWSELTPQQQQILKPLASEWDTLDGRNRIKWLGIARRYPKMTPIGQKRVQTRMAAWAKLTPDQRRKARDRYRKIGKLPPEKRDTVSRQWKEYQRLPTDVKKRLAAEQAKKTEKIEPRKRQRKAKKAKKAKPAAIAAPAPAVPPIVAPAAVAPSPPAPKPAN